MKESTECGRDNHADDRTAECARHIHDGIERITLRTKIRVACLRVDQLRRNHLNNFIYRAKRQRSIMKWVTIITINAIKDGINIRKGNE